MINLRGSAVKNAACRAALRPMPRWSTLGAALTTVALIFAVLAAPAHAAPKKRTVSLGGASTAVAGKPFVLKGKVKRTPKGTKVVLQLKSGGKWKTVQRATTKNAKGAYSAKITMRKAGSYTFRAKAAKAKVGGKKLKPAVSKPRTVTVRPAGEPPAKRLRLISRSAVTGAIGNGSSYLWSTRVGHGMSGDGRFTAFTSAASNLVAGDTNGKRDVFLYDRLADSVRLVSRSASGGVANGDSMWAAISPNGRWVAFRSAATNLVTSAAPSHGIYLWDGQTERTTLVSKYESGAGGTPVVSNSGKQVAFTDYNDAPQGALQFQQVYLWTGGTPGQRTLVSLSTAGGHGDSASQYPSISADGRYVAYQSAARNIVSGDNDNRYDVYLWDTKSKTNVWVSNHSTLLGGIDPTISADGRHIAYSTVETGGTLQVYLYDRITKGRTLVSTTPGGAAGNDRSMHPHVSRDGSYVAFESHATDLAPDDNTHYTGGVDVFVWTRASKQIVMASRTTPTDGPADNFSQLAQVSDDGRFVAFGSAASNLVPGDTNAMPDVFLWDRVGRP